MKQMTRTASGFEKHRKSTHRAQFLAQMHQVVPWATLCAMIEPHCRKGFTRPREFVGIDLGREPVPDVNAIWRFRLLLEYHGLGRQILAESICVTRIARRMNVSGAAP